MCTFPLLICNVIKLRHRITKGNREVVNAKSNLFQKHDHTTILTLLSFFYFESVSSRITYISILFIFIPFCYIISTLIFFSALLHFRTPSIVIDDSSWKNAAECFTVALTLTLGGYESAIAPFFLHCMINISKQMKKIPIQLMDWVPFNKIEQLVW